MRDDVAGPDGSALSEGLGPLPERCDQCRTPNACSDGACLEAYIGRRVQQEVATERERWRSATEYAVHQLEQSRVWNGFGWHYNPLPQPAMLRGVDEDYYTAEQMRAYGAQEQAEERQRCAKHLLEVAGECPEGGAVRSTLEACAGALLMRGPNVRAKLPTEAQP